MNERLKKTLITLFCDSLYISRSQVILSACLGIIMFAKIFEIVLLKKRKKLLHTGLLHKGLAKNTKSIKIAVIIIFRTKNNLQERTS